MTGLDELRAGMLHRKPMGMAKLIGIEVVEVEHGRVVMTATPGPEYSNMLGIMHGGFAATLLDSACGLAAYSATSEPVNCVTLEVKIAYHAALTDRVGPVRATGTLLSMTRRTAFTEAKLTDANDRLYASATSTLFITPRPEGASLVPG